MAEGGLELQNWGGGSRRFSEYTKGGGSFSPFGQDRQNRPSGPFLKLDSISLLSALLPGIVDGCL